MCFGWLIFAVGPQTGYGYIHNMPVTVDVFKSHSTQQYFFNTKYLAGTNDAHVQLYYTAAAHHPPAGLYQSSE